LISVEQLTIKVGSFSLSDISFEIPDGEYGMLMGKTGCGKTTLLEAICGLRQVSAGKIIIDGIDVTQRRPAERNIGFLPQDIALFDSMNVYDHLAFALRIKKWKRQQINERVNELAGSLQISHLLKRKPQGLSGGERQRVALGRALALRPSVLCLDEPLSTLDDETYNDVVDLMKTACRKHKITTLHISHRNSEAALLGDHLFELNDGEVSKREILKKSAQTEISGGA